MRDESAAVAELRRNCMPAVELLNSKTMLTKILFTYSTKLNIAFKLTLPIPMSIGGVSALSLARRRHCPRVANKGSPSYHAVRQNNASQAVFTAMFTVPDLSYNRCAVGRRASSREDWNRLTSVHRHDQWQLDDCSLPHRGSSICRLALCFTE